MATPNPVLIGHVYHYRARVPADCVRAFGRPVVKQSLGTRDPREARLLHARVAAEWAAYWDAMRRAPAEATLTDRQVQAVAGEVYRRVRPEGDARTDGAAFGDAVSLMHIGLVLQGLRNKPAWKRGERGVDPETVEVFDRLAGRCVLGEVTRARVLVAAADAAKQAIEQTQREFDGDLRPDPAADRFPPIDILPSLEPAAAAASPDAVWKVATTGCGPKTILKYRRIWDDLLRFTECRDLAKLTKAEVTAWQQDLLARDGLTPRTVQRDYLGTVKALLNAAVREELLEANPAAMVAVNSGLLRKGAVEKRGFTDDEAGIILRGTLEPVAGGRFFQAAVRWIPWCQTASEGGSSALCVVTMQ